MIFASGVKRQPPGYQSSHIPFGERKQLCMVREFHGRLFGNSTDYGDLRVQQVCASYLGDGHLVAEYIYAYCFSHDCKKAGFEGYYLDVLVFGCFYLQLDGYIMFIGRIILI